MILSFEEGTAEKGQKKKKLVHSLARTHALVWLTGKHKITT